MTTVGVEPKTGVGGGGRGRPVGVVGAAAFTGVMWMLIMLDRLFVSGAIGMGDNGDSRRLMCQLGVRASRPFGADPTKYVYTTWISHHWWGEACGADGSGEPYRSSELWLLRLARPVSRLLHYPGSLDLRALGVIAALFVGLVVAALVLVLPGRILFRAVLASLVGLAAADAAVAEYFISPYSEPAALLGILALFAALLCLWHNGRATWPRLILVTAIAAFTMTAKTQTVALFPAVAVAMLWLPHVGLDRTLAAAADEGPSRLRRRAHGRPSRLDRWAGSLMAGGGWLRVRWPALVACGILLAAVANFVDASPRRFSEVNAYHQVFLEILPHSHNRAADLRSLGVDPNLASASGANILDPRSAALRLPYLQFRDNVTQGTILRFYATHPDRLAAVASQGLQAVTRWRQDYLGTYTPSSGHQPGARECRVCVYTAAFTLIRHQPFLVAVLWLATLLAGIVVLRLPDLGPAEHALGRLAVVLVVAALCQFWAVMLSEGLSDLYKHMIFTNLLTALCIPTLIGCGWLTWTAAERGDQTATSLPDREFPAPPVRAYRKAPVTQDIDLREPVAPARTEPAPSVTLAEEEPGSSTWWHRQLRQSRPVTGNPSPAPEDDG